LNFITQQKTKHKHSLGYKYFTYFGVTNCIALKSSTQPIMSRYAILILAFFALANLALKAPQDSPQYADSKLVEQLIDMLPAMVSDLRATGIQVTPENYTWPAEAALHPKTLDLLEEKGFDPLKREGLLAITRTYFFMNYDSLDQKRQQIISSTKEQISENPYLTDEQKRINLRLLTGELGLSKAELAKKVTETNIRTLRPYSLILKMMWEKIRKEEEDGDQ
jgi:hypothetical protein